MGENNEDSVTAVPDVAPGQVWEYTGDIETFPKTVEVVNRDGTLYLMADHPTDEGEVEEHALFVLLDHFADWKLIEPA